MDHVILCDTDYVESIVLRVSRSLTFSASTRHSSAMKFDRLYLLCYFFLSSFCTEAGVRLQAQAVHFHLTYTQSFSSLLLKLLIDDDGRYIETTKSTQRRRKLQRYSGGGSYIKTTTTTVVYGKALPTSPHLFTSSPSVFSSRAQTLHRSSLPPLFKLRRPAVNGCEEAPP
ncbi:hypothetical protein YC2023_007927 [Brassica napus]